jgi:hypothetical protein
MCSGAIFFFTNRDSDRSGSEKDEARRAPEDLGCGKHKNYTHEEANTLLEILKDRYGKSITILKGESNRMRPGT